MADTIPCCSQMRYALDEPEVPLVWNRKLREVGIRVLDGGSSSIELLYCPWCGNKLPGSLRTEWFEALEKLNIDPWGEKIPTEFLDERWYELREKE